MTENRQRIERISTRLLEDIERRMDAEGGLELKDFKTVTGALKELRELCQQDGPEKDDVLRVRFVGDAEEMSG